MTKKYKTNKYRKRQSRTCMFGRQACACFGGGDDALKLAQEEAAAAQEMALSEAQNATESAQKAGNAALQAEKNKDKGFLSTLGSIAEKVIPTIVQSAAPVLQNVLQSKLG